MEKIQRTPSNDIDIVVDEETQPIIHGDVVVDGIDTSETTNPNKPATDNEGDHGAAEALEAGDGIAAALLLPGAPQESNSESTMIECSRDSLLVRRPGISTHNDSTDLAAAVANALPPSTKEYTNSNPTPTPTATSGSLPDGKIAAMDQKSSTGGIQRGLRRTIEERQAKLEARNARAMDKQHASEEVYTTEKGFQRGLSRTTEERQVKLDARKARAAAAAEQQASREALGRQQTNLETDIVGAVQVPAAEHPASEDAPTTNSKGIQRGLRRTNKERQVKSEASNAQAVDHTTTSKEESGLPPLRGLAKNREQQLNQSPNLPTNDAHGRGLRKNAPPRRGSRNVTSDPEDGGPCLTDSLENPEDILKELDEETATNAPGLSFPATHPPVPSIFTSRPSPLTSGSTNLAVAWPVQDDTASLMEAQEVDPEEIQRKEMREAKEQQKGRECRRIGYVILAACAIVPALTLGIKLGKKDEEKALSVAPTIAPSLGPSATPSSAPTGALDLLLQDLPNYTLKSLQNYSSPQWRARAWLDDHPELPVIEEWRKKQLFAFATFFYAMEGPDWPKDIMDNWLQYSDECYWWSREFGSFWNGKYSQEDNPPYNVTPCNERNEFQNIYLVRLELASHKPFIPPEINLLTSLSILALPFNGIDASIAEFFPTQLYQLSNLTELNMDRNSLWGSIPSEMGMMAAMVNLDLSENVLTGPIPSELGLLTSITGLDLYDNSLSGSIPSELGMMTSLVDISLGLNALAGPIPSELGLLTSLSRLFFEYNAFSGPIPSELGLLTSLSRLYLERNSFSGPIPIEVIALFPNMFTYWWRHGEYSFGGENSTLSVPSEIGLLASSPVDILDMSGMSLTGPIPSELGLLTNIAYLYLNDNRLSGSIPSELGLLTSLSRLYLEHNAFSGPIPIEVIALLQPIRTWGSYSFSFGGKHSTLSIPSEIGLLPSSLATLDLSGMSLTGPIPTELGLLTSSAKLYLYDNSLTGPIPSELGVIAAMDDLSLDGNALSGQIPSELGRLANMTALYLYDNLLSGSIPSELGLLTSSTKLVLYESTLFGSIPSELGMMTSMVFLGLNQNAFTGPIPSELGRLANMTALYLYDNRLSGSIPSELGLLTTTTTLYLHENSLSSSIPSELGMVSTMVDLALYRNALTGPIPTELGMLTSSTLFYLYDNSLSSSIPSELGMMSSMVDLALYQNSLTGPIPTEMGLMTKSTKLYLNENTLSESIPSELGMMTSMVELALYQNALTGPIPTELGMLTKSTKLYLYDNSLTGTIPSELGIMTSMRSCSLRMNNLSGSLPSQLGLMNYLEVLRAENNSLSGGIPTELGLLTNSIMLYLYDNSLSSSIPSELGMMASMVDLALYQNSLTGPIPTELGLLTSSTLFHLYDNSLSSSIPTELGMLTTMVGISLRSNALTGPIPSELGLLTSSRKLYLYDNTLFGSIPSELGMLTTMADFILRSNALTGPIPSELGLLTRMRDLDLSDNSLSSSIPSQLGMLTHMFHMNLHSNALTGPIPDELDALATDGFLETLTLANNSLAGTVPESLCSMGLFDLYWWSWGLGLSFDCSGQLCGCCWCPCPGSNSSGLCRTHRAEYDDEWPGSFPTSSNAIVINIRTNSIPSKKSLEWSLLSGPAQWKLLDTHSLEKASSVHSYTKLIEPGSLYKLQIHDSWGFGPCCNFGNVWFTITDSTRSHEYAEGTVVWKAVGDAFSYLDYLTVFLWIDAGGRAQQAEYLPGASGQGYALVVHDESVTGVEQSTIVASGGVNVHKNSSTDGVEDELLAP